MTDDQFKASVSEVLRRLGPNAWKETAERLVGHVRASRATRTPGETFTRHDRNRSFWNSMVRER